MGVFNIANLALAVLAVGGVLAHPQLSDQEAIEYKAKVARDTEALGRCLESPQMREINARALEQRMTTLKHMRRAQGIRFDDQAIHPRDKNALLKWVQVSHEHHDVHSNDPAKLFDFDRNKKPERNPAGCILTPESIYGPFWYDGEPGRGDITIYQKGIRMHLALQVIDVNTCLPLQGVRVDVWHANAAGQYSEKADGFLRGFQHTTAFGTVGFNSVFPGHYAGRATHVHVTVQPKNQNRYAHSGQMYFDETLRKAIEATEHYNGNKEPVVLNMDDDWAPSAASERYDPFVQWAWMGPSASNGVLAWTAMGVNLTDSNIRRPPDRKRAVVNDHLEH